MINPISRRNFLRSSALATVALSTGAIASPAMSSLAAASPQASTTAKPKPVITPAVKLGLASYTFRNFTRAQLIAFMKQLEITDLNAKDVKDHLPSTSPDAEDAALADYAANGIKLHAAGTIYLNKPDEADIKAKFEYCKRASINVMVAGDPTPETLPIVEKYVKLYDIRIAIHNHGPEDKIWHSPLDVIAAVKNLDPRIGCCIDIGHCERAGVDPAEAIHIVGPRLFDLHAKDLANFGSRDSQVAVGRGIIDIRGIFQALIATKYSGFVDLEYEINGDNPMPGVIESFAYMRGILNGMA